MNRSTRRVSQSFVPARILATTVLLLSLTTQGFAQSEEHHQGLRHSLGSLSSERMLADITILSSPAFNGRQTGTVDDAGSAKWVADQFLASGLSPAGTGIDPASPQGPDLGTATGLMRKGVTTQTIAPAPLLQIATASGPQTAQLGTDYLPILDSPSAAVHGPIVFVGYGIVDHSQGIDDYAGVDVTNALVLFLRGTPTHYKGMVSHAEKVRLARQQGAIGYLTATGPVLNAYEARRGVTGEPAAFYGLAPQSEAIPGAWISTALARQILAAPGPAQPDRLPELQDKLNRSPAAQSMNTGREGSLAWQTSQEQGTLTNVLAFLPGNDPQKAQELLIVGAHRDHFGRQAGLLFPGADDNASGTAVLLEVARVMAQAGARSKRTIVFISFSGEEQGLVGSRFYLDKPAAPIGSTLAMLNIDHAGIGNGRLTVGVTGFEKRVALEAGHTIGLTEKLDLFGFFPGGDHVPFKEAGIPTVTIVSGGAHPHFHKPSDRADTISPDILLTTARYLLALAWQLADAP